MGQPDRMEFARNENAALREGERMPGPGARELALPVRGQASRACLFPHSPWRSLKSLKPLSYFAELPWTSHILLSGLRGVMNNAAYTRRVSDRQRV